MEKTKLTDFQVWCLTNSITQWNTKNKASEKPYLNLDFFKKLFTITNAFKTTQEAVMAVGMTVPELYAKKETTAYEIPLLTDSEFEKLVDGVDTFEIYGWIKEKS